MTVDAPLSILFPADYDRFFPFSLPADDFNIGRVDMLAGASQTAEVLLG